MAYIPQKVQSRLAAGIKKFQPILKDAQSAGINESDTVMRITDMLSEVFGYDKYADLTSEKAIRGTFCDLEIKIDNKIKTLLEAKAISRELQDNHVKQVVDYALHAGIEWVILTNAVVWRIYKITYEKPVDFEMISEINFLDVKHNDECLEQLFLLTKESWSKPVLDDLFEQKQALSKFSIGAVILSENVLTAIRRELRRISPDVKIEVDQIRSVLEREVLKQEVIEGEKVDDTRKRISRANNRENKNKSESSALDQPVVQVEQKSVPPIITSPPPLPITSTISPQM